MRQQTMIIYYGKYEYKTLISSIHDRIETAQQNMINNLNLDEVLLVERTIHDHLKANTEDCFVYAGMSQHMHLIEIGAEGIYDDDSHPDFDVYSDNPVLHIKTICDKLKNTGKLKNIVAKNADHLDTYTIFVNYRKYIDITYMDKFYLRVKQLQHTLIKGIKYVHPHFMLIDLLRICNDPLHSVFRWQQTANRLHKLLSAYPWNYNSNKIIFLDISADVKPALKRVIDSLTKIDKLKASCVVTGIHAYRLYFRHLNKKINLNQTNNDLYNLFKVNNSDIPHTPFYEIITTNYYDTIETIWNYLLAENELNLNDLSIIEYYPFFQFKGKSCHIFYKEKIVAKIYDNNNTSIPYNETNTGLKFSSFQHLIMILLINKFQHYLAKQKTPSYDDILYSNYASMITNLLLFRQHYFDVINEDIMEDYRLKLKQYDSNYFDYVIKKNKGIKNLSRPQPIEEPELFGPINDTIMSDFVCEYIINEEARLSPKIRSLKQKAKFFYDPEKNPDNLKPEQWVYPKINGKETRYNEFSITNGNIIRNIIEIIQVISDESVLNQNISDESVLNQNTGLQVSDTTVIAESLRIDEIEDEINEITNDKLQDNFFDFESQ
jgi:hypothetical protein